MPAAQPFKEKLRWHLNHLQYELGRNRVQLRLDTRPDAAAPPLFDAHAVLMGDQQLAPDAAPVLLVTRSALADLARSVTQPVSASAIPSVAPG